MPVTVSSEELFHMGFIDYDQVNGPLKRIAARLQKQGIIGAYYHLTRTFRLKQVNGLDCIFLGSDRACTIYDRRPKICREFPDNGARPGYCPSQKKPTTTL